jgi:membrane-associated phospholipid phosphatase
MVRWGLVGIVLLCSVAHADEEQALGEQDTKPPGLFVGESWRYQHHTVLGGLVKRTLADLVAIPTGIGGWDWVDTTVASLTVAMMVAFEIPLYPSIDVRLQNSMQQHLGLNHLQIWTPYGDMLIWVALAGGYATALVYGLSAHESDYVESVILSIEAYIVTQVYTNLIKVVTGREPPGKGTGQGNFFGPEGYVRFFPAGTPSGHVAGMYALVSVMMNYWHNPVLWVFLNVFALLFAITNVADNYHYTSEVIAGSIIGIAVGRWVVRHRSSKYKYGKAGVIERIDLKPQVMPGGGAGMALSFSW